MKLKNFASAMGSLALVFAAGAARADIINFDEHTSPPVTCCFSDTLVTGPQVYAHATIQDGDASGFVMNSDGWANMQTSGNNLFGTLSGSIDFIFNTDVSNLVFDLINGTDSSVFNVTAFNAANDQIGNQVVELSGFSQFGSVGHLTFGQSGIRSLHILGNSDFAVDTISFNTGSVPEPASWALMISGFGLAGAMLRRRREVALAA